MSGMESIGIGAKTTKDRNMEKDVVAQLIRAGADLITKSDQILVFTGAGLSTESGIPDFRSPGGVWDRYDPAEFLFQKFISDERAREKYWQMSTEFYGPMKNALPSPGHLAIKELEELGKVLAVVTQNIDRLHHRAGNSPGKIIELHGTAFSVSCLSCGRKYDRDQIQERLYSGVKVPYCDTCSGILKPDTVSFGQSMPEKAVAEAFRYAEQCDLCLVLGSSLVVYPAAHVPSYALDHGAKLIIVNRDSTPLDTRAHLAIHDSIGKVLGAIMVQVKQLLFS
jgi:NAD-dependent deacetylase